MPRAIESAVWEDAGFWMTDGPAELFDSVLAGDELGPDDRLSIPVDPGTYRVRAAYAEPDQCTAFVLIQLGR